MNPREELKKYRPKEIRTDTERDNSENSFKDENFLSQLPELLQKIIDKLEKNEKISKKSVILMEPMNRSMKELQFRMNEFRDEIKDLKSVDNEKLDIIDKLIFICDIFDRMYWFSRDNENDNWTVTLKEALEQIEYKLGKVGLTTFPKDKVKFNPNIHICEETEEIEGLDSGIITEVIRKGYYYKDNLLREALVKVNK